MVTNTLWKRVRDWIVSVWKRGCVNPCFCTVIPIWKRGARTSQSPYGNGDYPFPYGDMSIPVAILGSPYGNGDPFVSNPHMETVINFSIWWSPNPYGDSKGNNRRGRQSQLRWWQRRLHIDGNNVCALAMGNDTAGYEVAMRWEAEAACHEAEATRGWEAAAARQVGRWELRQPDGEEEVKAKSWGGVGGGVTTGATGQPAGKQEANGRGGVKEANGKWEGRRQRTRGGGAPRGWEAAAARREALQQPAGGTSGASSSSSASFPPPPGWRRPSRDP